jgi:hypothetical protein
MFEQFLFPLESVGMMAKSLESERLAEYPFDGLRAGLVTVEG